MAAERYQLVGPLGSGGMAEVLLAKTRGPSGFERLLAVKRILPERAKDPEAVRMFLDEARNAAGLSHHRIVQVFDIELRDGVVFYAMEYLHGQTLDAVVARAPLSLAQSLAICISVADGLHYAHDKKIVHRDVAPSNIMVTYDGGVKLIDFGIAKAANNLSSTVFGTFKGRLGYSSPEQCRCEQVDRRTDVYSLAVVLYELTTGRRAFEGDDEEDLINRMADARIAPPPPDYPPELAAIVMKALARDRTQRYATAREFQHELEAFTRRANMNVSDVAMARFMADAFAPELEPWNRARATGVTLEDHVIKATLRTHSTIDMPTIERPPRKRRSRAPIIGASIVIALFVAAYLFARWVMAGS